MTKLPLRFPNPYPSLHGQCGKINRSIHSNADVAAPQHMRRAWEKVNTTQALRPTHVSVGPREARSSTVDQRTVSDWLIAAKRRWSPRQSEGGERERERINCFVTALHQKKNKLLRYSWRCAHATGGPGSRDSSSGFVLLLLLCL